MARCSEKNLAGRTATFRAAKLQRGKLLRLREGISIQRGRLAQEVTLRLAGALDQGAERLELLAIRWNDAKLHVDQRKFMVVLEPAASGPVRPGSGKKKMPYVVDSMNDPDGTSFKCKNGKYAILGIASVNFMSTWTESQKPS